MKVVGVIAAVLVMGRAVPVRAAEPPSYVRDIQPFIAKYCVECHDVNKPKAGLRLTTYQDLFQDHKKGKPVIPGQPNDGSFVRTIEGRAKLMPPKNYKARPTADEIALFKTWIMAGAKNDATKGGE